MTEAEQHQQRLVTAWHTSFKKGTDYDLWGQPVEATSEYHRSHSLSFSFQNNLTSIQTQIQYCNLKVGTETGRSWICFWC